MTKLAKDDSGSSPYSRLSKIDTQWSIVDKAHRQSEASDAFAILFERYTPAIRRYLLASLRDPDAAQEVFQEFALKLVKGSFKNAKPEKGKFRSMIKTALYRLMVDYHRRKNRNRNRQTEHPIDHVALAPKPEQDDSFVIQWRQSLLDEAWVRLEFLERQCGRPYFTVLRTRVDSANLTTRQLHEKIKVSRKDIPDLSAFRVFIHRARKRFAMILVELVRESLNQPTDDEIEQELIDLGLHHYVQA